MNFSDAILNNCDLTGSDIRSCNFDGSDLSGADLSDCRIATGLEKAPKEIQAQVTEHFLWISSAGKKGARASFKGMDLTGIDLSGADLSAADFTATNLTGAVLKQCSFRFAVFTGAVLSQANLSRADLRGTKLDGIQADGVDFSQSRLTPMQILKPSTLEVQREWPSDLSNARVAGAMSEPGQPDRCRLG